MIGPRHWVRRSAIQRGERRITPSTSTADDSRPIPHAEGAAAMLTDHVLQQMYALAHGLYPHTGGALSVTMTAVERLVLLRRLQDRRTGSSYRHRLPEACLPQYCVYLASDARERAQESPMPGRDAPEPSPPDDYLVRYIKTLVWWTMDRNACHVAVALGCFLYGYRPGDLASLAPDFFPLSSLRRVKQQLAGQLHARFASTYCFTGAPHTFSTHPATPHERQVVHNALVLCTPWDAHPIVPSMPPISQLNTHFGEGSTYSDWDRIHALINPATGGFAGLIRDYNAGLPPASAMSLDNPDDRLAIPDLSPSLSIPRA
jgi:hypothetical protein